MRSAHLLIAVAAVLLLTLLVMWAPWAGDAEADWRASADAGYAKGALSADAHQEGPDGAGGLAGRGAREGGAVGERGPVTVTVIGHGGRRLAGVPVRLMRPSEPPDEETAPKSEEPAAPELTPRAVSDPPLSSVSIVDVGDANPMEALTSGLTDADGVVVFPDVPYDGTHAVELRRDGQRFANTFGSSVFEEVEDTGIEVEEAHPDADGASAGSIVLLDDMTSGAELVDIGRPIQLLNPGFGVYRRWVDGPEIELAVPGGIPLAVQIVSAARGRRVGDATWEAGPRYVGAQQEPEGASTLIGVEIGQTARVAVDLKVPRGYVRADRNVFGTWISPEAKRLEAHVPLRVEAEIIVSIKGDLQIRDPAKLTGTVYLANASRYASNRFTLDGFGRLRVAGLPHFARELVEVDLTYGDKSITGSGRLGRDPSDPLVIEAASKKLKPPEAEAIWSSVSFDDDLWVEFFGELNLQRTVYTQAVEADPKTTGRIAARVFRADGTPAEGAVVHLIHGDQVLFTRKDGRVLFQGLEPGPERLAVLGAGTVAFHAIEVVAGQEGRAEIRADLGGRIRLEVVDEEGEPVPYAEVTIEQPSEWEWVEVVDGVQRVDPFTNHRGVRTFHRVEAGTVTVNALYGSRYARGTVEVVQGRTVAFRLTLGTDTTGTPSSESEAK